MKIIIYYEEKMFKYFVYILRCQSCRQVTRYYTGMSKRPKERYWEHRNGKSKYTKRYGGNLTIEYLELLEERNEKEAFKIARKRELKIKKFSQKRKMNLIEINRARSLDLIERYMTV